MHLKKRMIAILLVCSALLGTFAFAENKQWKCPECDTLNEGKYCTECGSKKPEDEQRVTNIFATKELLFREIPWGSNVEAVNKKMKKDGINIHLLDPSVAAAYRIENLVAPFTYGMYDLYLSEAGISSYATVDSMKSKVGGYKVESAVLYFVYRPDDSKIVRDDKHAALCAGSYFFNVVDADGVFEDLKEKLSSVYGMCSCAGGPNILEQFFGATSYFWTSYDIEEYFAIWETADSYLALRKQKPATETDALFGANGVAIVYISKDMDRWLEESYQVTKEMSAESEQSSFGNGEIDGL